MAKIVSFLFLIFLFSCSSSSVDTNRKLEEEASADRNDEFIRALSMTQLIDATSSCTIGDVTDIQKKNRYLSNSKDKALTSFELGLCYRYLGDFSKSLYYFDLGLSFAEAKRNKLRSAFFYNIGQIYFKAKSYLYARDYFQRALDENPASDHAKWGFVLLYMENGFYSQALNYVNPLLKAYPVSRVLLSAKSMILFLLNDFVQLESKLLSQFNDTDKEYLFFKSALLPNRAQGIEEIKKMNGLPFILERMKNVVLEKLNDEDKTNKN